MGRKRARPEKSETRRDPAREDFKWESAVNAALASLPGMVSSHLSPDYPRLVIRLP